MNITVLIGGRPYPLTVEAKDEPLIRRVVKEINEKINEFQLTYKQSDKQDCLTMALLTYAVDLAKVKQGNLDPYATEKILKLEQIIDIALISNS